MPFSCCAELSSRMVRSCQRTLRSVKSSHGFLAWKPAKLFFSFSISSHSWSHAAPCSCLRATERTANDARCDYSFNHIRYSPHLIRLQDLLFNNLILKGFLCPISLFSHYKGKKRNWVCSHAWTHSSEVSFPLVIPDMGSHIKSVLAGQNCFKLKWNSAAFTASVYLSYIPHHLLGQWRGSVDSLGTRAGWGAAGTLGYMWWRAGWASTLLCPGARCEITQMSKSWCINSILCSEILEEKGHILCDAKNQIIPAFTWGQSLVQARSQQWWKWRFPFPWHHEAQLELFPLNTEAEHKGQCLWK